jgi:thioredoxin 1
MANEKVVILDKDNFEQEVIQSDKPVLIDFWASWCGPCRAVAPVIDQLAEEFSGKAKVGKINVDEQNELASRYRIMSIPTVMLFKNGQVVEKLIGARSREEFSKLIENNL